VNHFDVGREQIFYAVFEDGMRVSAADFHEFERRIGQTRNLFSEPSRKLALPVLVYEFHLLFSEKTIYILLKPSRVVTCEFSPVFQGRESNGINWPGRLNPISIVARATWHFHLCLPVH
jgi:hypothetical protein